MSTVIGQVRPVIDRRRIAAVIPELRSSGLERMPARNPGVRFYAWRRSTDLDVHLLEPRPDVVVGTWKRTVLQLIADSPAVLEVPEPLWYRRWPAARLCILAADAGALIRRRARPVVVSYAIENLAVPEGLSVRRRKWPAHRLIDPLLARVLDHSARRVDRLAFGTSGAEAAYTTGLPRTVRSAERRVIAEELPRCEICADPEPDAAAQVHTVLYAAAFEYRKGITDLMAVWPAVAAAGWRLVLAGFGPLTPEVRAWAAGRDDVDVRVSPARAELHRLFRRAGILVLPSRRAPGWREQVGLSLLEGRAHGCLIVSTDETGLAPLLRREGHFVAPAGDGPALASALRAAMSSPVRPATAVPAEDSRRAFERWAWRPAP